MSILNNQNKRSLIGYFSAFLAFFTFPSIGKASEAVRSVSGYQAQGQGNKLVEVKIYPPQRGNTILNFRPTEERIRQVSIGNANQVEFSSDDPACLSSAAHRSSNQCEATILYLQQVSQNRESKVSSSRMTVLTDNHLYLFNLVFASGVPEYYVLEIQPGALTSQSTQNSLKQLETLLRGIAEAKRRNYLANPQFANRIQRFVELLRQGQDLNASATEAGISLDAVRKFEELGQEVLASPTLPLTPALQ